MQNNALLPLNNHINIKTGLWNPRHTSLRAVCRLERIICTAIRRRPASMAPFPSQAYRIAVMLAFSSPTPFYITHRTCSMFRMLSMTGRRLKPFAFALSGTSCTGYLVNAYALALFQERSISNSPCSFSIARSRGDSNPRNLAVQRFSRPPPSTTRTPLQYQQPDKGCFTN